MFKLQTWYSNYISKIQIEIITIMKQTFKTCIINFKSYKKFMNVIRECKSRYIYYSKWALIRTFVKRMFSGLALSVCWGKEIALVNILYGYWNKY